MQFSLTGFSQRANVRLFAFQGTDGAHSRQHFTVGVDVDLARHYAISLQDLPLLCRRFLEEQTEVGELRLLTLSEQEMAGIASRREEAKRQTTRKPFRRAPTSEVGTAWR